MPNRSQWSKDGDQMSAWFDIVSSLVYSIRHPLNCVCLSQLGMISQSSITTWRA